MRICEDSKILQQALYHARTICACHILNLSPPLQQQTDRKATRVIVSTQSCTNLNSSALISLGSFACEVSNPFQFVLSFRAVVGQCKKRCEVSPNQHRNPWQNGKVYPACPHLAWCRELQKLSSQAPAKADPLAACCSPHSPSPG